MTGTGAEEAQIGGVMRLTWVTDRLAHVQEHALAELNQALGCRRHPHLAADPEKQRLAKLLFEQ